MGETMTNGDFFNALEIMGYETIEDCPLSEEQVENIAKTIATVEQERDTFASQLAQLQARNQKRGGSRS
jgi:hypothetical protein